MKVSRAALLLRRTTLLPVAFVLSGCATNRMTQSGFLVDYNQLKPSQFKNVHLYTAPGFDPSQVASASIEAPSIVGTSKRLADMSDDNKRLLVEHLRAAVSARMQAIKPTSGATRTVRVRSALTDFDSPNRTVNAALTLLTGPVTTGGASLEVEVVDAATGERLVAASCFETGNVVTDFMASYSLLGHAKLAIDQCLERFAAAYERRSAAKP